MARTATTRAKAAAPKRVSPLDHVIAYGRFGADRDGGPGVALSLRHPVSMVTVIARKGKAAALSEVLKQHYGFEAPAPGRSASARGTSIQWCGAEQWFVVRDDKTDGALCKELATRLDGLGSVSDQSHGRLMIRISGSHARDVLAKGTPVDLHPKAFAVGDAAVTQMAHVSVHFCQVAPDVFELSVFRGFAESFWEWLTEMSLEFGYEVV